MVEAKVIADRDTGRSKEFLNFERQSHLLDISYPEAKRDLHSHNETSNLIINKIKYYKKQLKTK